jgi:hypothetical protein
VDHTRSVFRRPEDGRARRITQLAVSIATVALAGLLSWTTTLGQAQVTPSATANAHAVHR